MTTYERKRKDGTTERVRPVPGSKEDQRLRQSKGYTVRKAQGDPPKPDSGQGTAPTGQAQVEKGPEKPAEGERRTATARGTAKIRAGGGSK